MKKTILFLIAISAIALSLSSCEQNVDAELPYKEQLVIRAVLEADVLTKDITITRTLPPLVDYTYDAALVINADAYIIGPGEKKYKLIYNPSSQKYKVDSLIPKAGETYRFEASANGKYAYAQTIIPEKVTIENFALSFEKVESWRYESWLVVISAYFKPINDYVYIAGVRRLSQGRDYLYDYVYDEIKQPSDILSDGRLKIHVVEHYTSDTSSFNLNAFKGQESFIESYDNQFYSYYNSRNDGSSNSDIFGTSGSNIRWNIKGDGIGLFIGLNRAAKVI